MGFNSFGLFFLYWGEIQLCKIRADEYSDADYMPAKPVRLFSSGNQNFKLVDEKEILCAGKLYDIVRKEIVNGATLYYALSDEDEDGYVQNLTDWGKNNAEEKSLPGKTINLHLSKYFNGEINHPGLPGLCQLPETREFLRDKIFYTSPGKNIFTPPPEV